MSTEEEDKYSEHLLKIWTKISEETGIREEMIWQIHCSVVSERKTEVKITSKNASQYIIQDLINKDLGSIQDQLRYNGIKSSEDFGTVIKKLCENQVLFEEENDNYDDFNGQFTVDTIFDFIKLHKIRKERDIVKIIIYTTVFIGFLFVFSNNKAIGPIGWSMVTIGWLLYIFQRRIKHALARISKNKN